MPRRVIIGGGVLAFAIAIVVIVIVVRGGGDERTAHDDRSARSTAMQSTTSDATPITDEDTQPRRLQPLDHAPIVIIGSGAAPVPPPEAQHDMLEAFTARRFDDVRELCAARDIASTHAYECTIAACKTHSGMQARRFYVAVSDADRAKVEAECTAENVPLERPERPGRLTRPHPGHGRKGVPVDD